MFLQFTQWWADITLTSVKHIRRLGGLLSGWPLVGVLAGLVCIGLTYGVLGEGSSVMDLGGKGVGADAA